MVANSRSKLLKLRTTRVLPRAFANSCDKSMSNPSNWPDVSLYDSNGGNGTLVPTTNVALAAGLKTNHPTPTPARNVMTAITTTIAVLMPLAAPERLASGGGAPPPSAIPGANACHYLNVTGKSDDWTENELAAAQRPSLRRALEAFLEDVQPCVEDIPRDVQRGNVPHRRVAAWQEDQPVLYASFSIASRSFGSGFFECLSVTNSVACIMPRPRRSPMNSYRSAISSSRRARWSPTFALRATRPSSSITSSVASDAAHATGFPPKVFECFPLSLKSISAGYTAAPIGSPPPRDLAIVKMSGTASECSIAHIFPVRPRPDWTSSSIRSAPWSFAIFAIRSIHPGGGTMYPPSPWTGAMNISRFVWLFATLIAASFASVPELPKNTFFRCLPGVILPRRSARVAWIS